MPVAGDTGGIIYDGLPHSNQTVEKRRLSYIRSTYYCYQTHKSNSLIIRPSAFVQSTAPTGIVIIALTSRVAR